MSTDPDQIRAQVTNMLADLPDADVETIAARLEAAHDVLVQALESVEKG